MALLPTGLVLVKCFGQLNVGGKDWSTLRNLSSFCVWKKNNMFSNSLMIIGYNIGPHIQCPPKYSRCSLLCLQTATSGFFFKEMSQCWRIDCFFFFARYCAHAEVEWGERKKAEWSPEMMGFLLEVEFFCPSLKSFKNFQMHHNYSSKGRIARMLKAFVWLERY